jgi:hypothetical protein
MEGNVFLDDQVLKSHIIAVTAHFNLKSAASSDSNLGFAGVDEIFHSDYMHDAIILAEKDLCIPAETSSFKALLIDFNGHEAGLRKGGGHTKNH